MTISSKLLSILACPDDHAPVKITKHGKQSYLRCTKCRRRFPIENGIPIMLPKEE